MALIEIGPLSQHLDDDEIVAIKRAFAEADVAVELDDDADAQSVEKDIDDDIFADFLDRLDAQGASCDFYVPGDFEDVVEASGYTIGSTHALMMALDELRDDIIGDEDENEDDEPDAFEDFEDGDEDRFSGGGSEAVHIQESELRHLWKVLYKGARASTRSHTCLFVRR